MMYENICAYEGVGMARLPPIHMDGKSASRHVAFEGGTDWCFRNGNRDRALSDRRAVQPIRIVSMAGKETC